MSGTPIDSLSAMSPQARAALKRVGFTSLEKACLASDRLLLDIPGFKEASLRRLRLWQETPEAEQPAAGRFGGTSQREGRIFSLYGVLRANGHSASEAGLLAEQEVDTLTERLRGGGA